MSDAMIRPSLFDDNADPDRWSNMSDGSGRLTWREAHDRTVAEVERLRPVVALVADLDRCIHGRHVPDVCFDCQRNGSPRNEGNRWLDDGQRIGTTLGGRPIIVRFVDGVVRLEVTE
jgi:hypothetical protein